MQPAISACTSCSTGLESTSHLTLRAPATHPLSPPPAQTCATRAHTHTQCPLPPPTCISCINSLRSPSQPMCRHDSTASHIVTKAGSAPCSPAGAARGLSWPHARQNRAGPHGGALAARLLHLLPCLQHLPNVSGPEWPGRPGGRLHTPAAVSPPKGGKIAESVTNTAAPVG